MLRHLNSPHLLLKVAWTAAQRGDVSTREEPPATHLCQLALALCPPGKMWWGHRVPGTKVRVTRSCRYREYQSPCFAPSALCVCANLSGCQRICNRSSQRGFLSSFPFPSYFTGMPSSPESGRSKAGGLLMWEQTWATVLLWQPSHQGQWPGHRVGVPAAGCPQAAAGRGAQAACSWGLEAQWGALSASAAK